MTRVKDTPLPDGEYELTDGAGWFTVKGFAVRISKTDEGVVVDVFDNEAMMAGVFSDEALLTSTYAFDCDCDPLYYNLNHGTDS